MDTLKVLVGLGQGEDHDTVVQAIEDSGLPVEVTARHAPALALETLLDRKFDCTFVAAGAPDFDGLDLMAELRRAGNPIPVIMMVPDGSALAITELLKAGGLTEAIKLANAARQKGVSIMMGCMIGTSLGMAPAFLLGAYARLVDLDGPLLLAKDREPGIKYSAGGVMQPPPPELWG